VLGTVELGGGPESSVADGKGFVFTNLEDKSEMVKIDAGAMTVAARWKLAPCEAPSSLGTTAPRAGCLPAAATTSWRWSMPIAER
jgi:hypothetical protein